MNDQQSKLTREQDGTWLLDGAALESHDLRITVSADYLGGLLNAAYLVGRWQEAEDRLRRATQDIDTALRGAGLPGLGERV